ncbi:MAG: hypothetical protein U9O83_01085 [Campylobacterota bacterium]|nr:hypothetical protein [Campylobacterota bacterium]
MKKIILHLCADLGSDSRYYQLDDEYEVIKVGKEIGVENYHPPKNVYGIIANPPCNEFSTAKCFTHVGNLDKGMELVNHCLRIIDECESPTFWVIENPAKGRLREKLGSASHTYQPWEYGSPWTKHTALWGAFYMPKPIYTKWEDVPKNDKLYIRNGRKKPSLVYLHKSAIDLIPEFEFAREHIKCDADIRSMCSQGFAKAFYNANK